MLIKLETELAKLNDIKKFIEELRVSLWQGSLRKTITRIRLKNARARILGRYKKGRRSN
mgnify:FL=1